MIWWPLWIATIVIFAVTVIGIIVALAIEHFQISGHGAICRHARAEKVERWETCGFFVAIFSPALCFIVWDILSWLGIVS